MMFIRESSPKNKYDKRHDVMHVFLDNQINAFADEEYPGIYVNRNEDTDKVVGFTIMDFSKQKDTLKLHYPEYDFY